jgi:hypothetical protein
VGFGYSHPLRNAAEMEEERQRLLRLLPNPSKHLINGAPTQDFRATLSNNGGLSLETDSVTLPPISPRPKKILRLEGV